MSEESTSVGIWITSGVTIVLALVASVWKLAGRSAEKGESQNAKDIARVEQQAKDEIARVERRLDSTADDHIKLHERTAVNESEIKRIKEDIGDHDSGIRGWLHQLSNAFTPRALRRQQRRQDRGDEG